MHRRSGEEAAPKECAGAGLRLDRQRFEQSGEKEERPGRYGYGCDRV